MKHNRRDALDEFLAYTTEYGDSEARNLAERLLNRAIERIWLLREWPEFASNHQAVIQLVTGQRTYALPADFGRLYQRTLVQTMPGSVSTSARTLTETQWQIAQDEYPLAGTTLEVPGPPLWFTLGGVVGVPKQPVPGKPARVMFRSSHLDDIDVEMTVVGIPEFETEAIPASVMLAGVNQVVTEHRYTYVQSVTKAIVVVKVPPVELTSSRGEVWVDFVHNPVPPALTEVVGVIQLQPEEAGRDYRTVTFWPTPGQAETVRVPYIRRPLKLIRDSDGLPDGWWPAIFEEMVIQWRVQNGEVALDASLARPCLRDLVSFENQTRPRYSKRAWSMRPWPQ